MSTDHVIRIIGRNELGLAVKQAEQQLRGLAKTGDLIGKLFRGGAIVGAVMAFERLAENAEKAARAVGDEGTAKALGMLNSEIDKLKAKGTNLIGQVLGSVYTTYRGTEAMKLTKDIVQLRGEIDRLMQSNGGNAAGLGPGFQQKVTQLAEFEKRLRQISQLEASFTSRRAGAVSRGGGSGILTSYSSVFDDPADKPSKGIAAAKGPSPALLAIEKEFERATMYVESMTAATDDAAKALDEHFSKALEDTAGQVTTTTLAVAGMSEEMTLMADQAARNMQTTFADFLFDPFKDGLAGMLSGFIDTIRRMVAEAAAAEILRGVFTWAAGATTGKTSSFFASMAGARAGGGPVMGGSAYLVGERGPEIFVPGTSGNVVANGAGGISLSYSIDARGADAERIMAILPGLLKQTSDQTVQRIRDLNGRGRL